MAFKTQLGQVFTPGPDGHEWRGRRRTRWVLSSPRWGNLAAGPRLRSFPCSTRATYLGDLRAHAVTTVIVGPGAGSAQVARLMTELIGRPGESTGGVTVWYGVPAMDG